MVGGIEGVIVWRGFIAKDSGVADEEEVVAVSNASG